MTLQELQKQVLELPISDRRQLVQILLESLHQETHPAVKKGNLSRLCGIAKNAGISADENVAADYATYLTEKYQ
ncbi:hypothetical protein NIES4074_19680 [Cylindrospermum sp. NIES-4074]|nr:hypothetical protein NIES4074_19680 [Cylindrospermum sp. NIES-4074]